MLPGKRPDESFQASTAAAGITSLRGTGRPLLHLLGGPEHQQRGGPRHDRPANAQDFPRRQRSGEPPAGSEDEQAGEQVLWDSVSMIFVLRGDLSQPIRNFKMTTQHLM